MGDMLESLGFAESCAAAVLPGTMQNLIASQPSQGVALCPLVGLQVPRKSDSVGKY